MPVSLDELVSSRQLEFDLYQANGKLLFPAGTPVPRGELQKFKQTPLYREFQDLPFLHEGVILSAQEPDLTEAQRQQGQDEYDHASVYGTETNQAFLSAMAGFWERLEAGDTPNLALCELVRDALVSELVQKADQVHCLSQLRVRDGFTYSHTLHVAALSIALGMQAGLSKGEIRDLGLSAILHDLGKFLIPKPIMFKPSRLTEQEFNVMKLHPGLGYNIIREELRLADHLARPALEHQEMYGGGGYPNNLQGDEIHPFSHIVKIADVYEALTARRPYKDPIPSEKAIEIMTSDGDKSFHPELLRTFVAMAQP
jgi:HD-GYP domain-containing protein (c-di-GMP phosphodiesterase class II)